MIENLIETLRSEVGSKILSQNNLQSDTLGPIFTVIGDETKKEVTGQMLGGGLSNVMTLFSNQSNTPAADLLQSNISSRVMRGLSVKLGLPQDISKNIASVALPGLFNLITRKNSTTPDDDPSPLHELFGITGKSGILGAAKKFLRGFLRI